MPVARTAPIVHRSGGVAVLDQVVRIHDAAGPGPALDDGLGAFAAAVGIDHRRGLSADRPRRRLPDPGPGGRLVGQVVLHDLAVRPRDPVERVGPALRDARGFDARLRIHEIEVAERLE